VVVLRRLAGSLVVVVAVLRWVVVAVTVAGTVLGILGFLWVHWHHVRHLLGLFVGLLSLHAGGGAHEQTEGDDAHACAHPGHHVGPVEGQLGVFDQNRVPGRLVREGPDSLLLEVVHSVPEPHSTGREDAGAQHEESSSGDVGRGSPPAPRNSGEESRHH